jgi:hypothetical protein
MIEIPSMMIAAERQRELRAEAGRRALVRLATCCRPGALRRVLTAWQQRHQPVSACCA